MDAPEAAPSAVPACLDAAKWSADPACSLLAEDSVEVISREEEEAEDASEASLLNDAASESSLDSSEWMTTSNYAQAVFHNVPDVADCDSDLPVDFSVSDLVELDNAFVGIYRIPDLAPMDFVARLPVGREDAQGGPNSDRKHFTLVFPAKVLLKQDEIYQLQFVCVGPTATAECKYAPFVMGSSVPFQLKPGKRSQERRKKADAPELLTSTEETKSEGSEEDRVAAVTAAKDKEITLLKAAKGRELMEMEMAKDKVITQLQAEKELEIQDLKRSMRLQQQEVLLLEDKIKHLRCEIDLKEDQHKASEARCQGIFDTREMLKEKAENCQRVAMKKDAEIVRLKKKLNDSLKTLEATTLSLEKMTTKMEAAANARECLNGELIRVKKERDNRSGEIALLQTTIEKVKSKAAYDLDCMEKDHEKERQQWNTQQNEAEFRRGCRYMEDRLLNGMGNREKRIVELEKALGKKGVAHYAEKAREAEEALEIETVREKLNDTLIVLGESERENMRLEEELFQAEAKANDYKVKLEKALAQKELMELELNKTNELNLFASKEEWTQERRTEVQETHKEELEALRRLVAASEKETRLAQKEMQQMQKQLQLKNADIIRRRRVFVDVVNESKAQRRIQEAQQRHNDVESQLLGQLKAVVANCNDLSAKLAERDSQLAKMASTDSMSGESRDKGLISLLESQNKYLRRELDNEAKLVARKEKLISYLDPSYTEIYPGYTTDPSQDEMNSLSIRDAIIRSEARRRRIDKAIAWVDDNRNEVDKESRELSELALWAASGINSEEKKVHNDSGNEGGDSDKKEAVTQQPQMQPDKEEVATPKLKVVEAEEREVVAKQAQAAKEADETDEVTEVAPLVTEGTDEKDAVPEQPQVAPVIQETSSGGATESEEVVDGAAAALPEKKPSDEEAEKGIGSVGLSNKHYVLTPDGRPVLADGPAPPGPDGKLRCGLCLQNFGQNAAKYEECVARHKRDRECPVCSQMFDSNYLSVYIRHVQEHFPESERSLMDQGAISKRPDGQKEKDVSTGNASIEDIVTNVGRSLFDWAMDY